MRGILVTVFLISSVSAGIALGACSDGTAATPADVDAGDDNDQPEAINSGDGVGTGSATGLPCDVQQLLENRCIGCHLVAIPPPLTEYDEVVAPAPSDPSKTMAQKAVERMKSTTAPMPPKPAVPPTASEIATFEAWVNAGAPKNPNVCTPKPASDAGIADSGPSTNYNTPLVCTSKQTWKNSDKASATMRPGGTCITCHTMRGGPAFTIAGTVYPSAHEPTNCFGSNVAGMKVVITDKNGVTKELAVNTVGNFYSAEPVAAPFQVKIVNGTRQRAMAGLATAGDCNTCHTATGGNGAPGRIMAP